MKYIDNYFFVSNYWLLVTSNYSFILKELDIMLATFKLVFVEVLNSFIFKEQLKELDIMLTIFKLVFSEVLNSFIFK